MRVGACVKGEACWVQLFLKFFLPGNLPTDYWTCFCSLWPMITLAFKLKSEGPLENALLQVARWSTTNRIAKTKKRLSIQELRHFINKIIIEVICSTPFFFSNFNVRTFAASTYNNSPLDELASLGSGPTSPGFHYLSWFKQEGGVVWISPGQVVTKSITHKFRYMTNSLV